ncbi:hypothetical protein Bra3105_00100 [Brachybacterium halotolerans subsp. kimchii]|uniref:hypothetical protein n=1 Tax=Brachybacterium halotolerans TaxID=2795215 RepID=UPI001E4B61F8|nr:hypothetical protein [Brachybacterium halotolerans]UEJ82774.1 hypothetical protein Bra3105_00100 [Brachybacterium halotolerans subsp. kimchii]
MNLRDRYPRYFAYEDLLSAVERVVSGYRRTVDGGTPVTFTHSHRDVELPADTVRVTAGGDTLDLTVDAWIEHLETAEAYVLAWVTARVHLQGATLTSGRGRPDPYWQDAVRQANPGRR